MLISGEICFFALSSNVRPKVCGAKEVTDRFLRRTGTAVAATHAFGHFALESFGTLLRCFFS